MSNLSLSFLGYKVRLIAVSISESIYLSIQQILLPVPRVSDTEGMVGAALKRDTHTPAVIAQEVKAASVQRQVSAKSFGGKGQGLQEAETFKGWKNPSWVKEGEFAKTLRSSCF